MTQGRKFGCAKENLAKIRAYLRACLKEYGIGDDFAEDVIIAVDEACTNSIVHAHGCNASEQIRLRVIRNGGFLVIELDDPGNMFDPNSYEPREMKDLISTGSSGGMGIRIIRGMMDKTELVPLGNGFCYRFFKRLY